MMPFQAPDIDSRCDQNNLTIRRVRSFGALLKKINDAFSALGNFVEESVGSHLETTIEASHPPLT
jgi:hypothetical protein